jgi:hypothetical protein
MAEIAAGLPKWQPQQIPCQTFLVRGLLLANTVPQKTFFQPFFLFDIQVVFGIMSI